MGYTMRVSLPSIDALTNGTIDQYSVYADSDNILIKEFSRGTINIANLALGTVNHNLGYIPLTFVFAKNGGSQAFLAGGDANSSFPATYTVGTGNVVITNNFSGTKTFNYFIFYDQGTTL